MTKLLPFDLEAAKAGAKVVTRDGRPARIVCFDKISQQEDLSIIALISNGDYEIPLALYKNGKVLRASEECADLFMAPTPVKRWRVIYRGDDDNAAQMDFEQYKDASKFWCENDFSAKPFEVEVTP